MTAPKTYPTLRAYVDAQPRSVTQKDIAARLGISAASLSYYLSGKRFPSSVTAFRICQRCGVPLHRLLRTA
jgi:transcriptional regulator with XRE-family HTH domain